jgi:mono/diheme cytochrome c family protein
MKRTTVNVFIDLLAAFLFVGMVVTGYLLYFTLPPGTNKTLSLWSLSRHQWGQVHFWISLGLLAVLLVHIALHWQWVLAIAAQRLGLAKNPSHRPIWTGVITLLALVTVLVLFAWVAEVSVVEREDPDCPPDEAPDGARIPSARPGTQASFWKEVYPILETSCLRCHGPNRSQGGFRVDRREDYFGKSGKPAFVVPGKSTESPLIDIVLGRRTDMAMAASHTLTEEDVAILRAWIDSGADWPESPPAPSADP